MPPEQTPILALRYLPEYRTSQDNLTPDQARSQPQFRALEIQDDWVNESERTIKVPISSEYRVTRWWSDEILGHSADNVSLDRIRKVGSFLFAHGRDINYGVVPLGPIVDVWLEENDRQLWAVLKFDDSEESEKLFKKVREKSLRGISIGYSVQKWRWIDEDEIFRGHQGPAYYALEWEPHEISLEPTPADPSVGGRTIIIDNERTDITMGAENKGNENSVNPTNPEGTTRNHPEQPNALSGEDVRAQERQRCSEITALCRDYQMDPQEHIDANRTIEQVRKIVLDKLAEQRKAVPVATVLADERDKFRSAATEGLCVRAGIPVEKPSGTDLRGIKLTELARLCAENATGQRFKYGDDDELIRTALSSASDFPLILSNVANKSMATGYQTAPTTFEQFTRKGFNPNFKPATRVRLSEADELKPMKDNGEFESASVSESGQVVKIGTYGRKFSLTRRMIIDDDLGAFTDLPAAYAAAAKRMINRMVYASFAKNPTMDDKAALFHATHKNLAAVGSRLSVKSLGDGRAAMKQQKNIGGQEALNITPAFLLLPTLLETEAEQLIGSLVDPSKSNATYNPFTRKLNIVCDPELDTYSQIAWYLAAAPGSVDTIEVTYLPGKETPTLESKVSFDILGIEYRIYHDFGVTALDYRGLYMNPGAEAQ